MLRILQVIHGYPPRYNAGSEVYTQTLSRELARQGNEVAIFSRREDPFIPGFELSRVTDSDDPRLRRYEVNVVNIRDRYSHQSVDSCFEQALGEFGPHVIHVGHLNHLSTSIVKIASQRGTPVVFTLHDFWLMCPRGQFVQTNLGKDAWALCDGQEDYKCATRCYSRYYTGLPAAEGIDVGYWKNWVHERMTHIREIADQVSLFISPSDYLRRRFVDEFGLPSEKVLYLDYGFETARLRGRARKREREFVFGYIGTHTVSKGINLLIEAFGKVQGETRLRIWGRENPQVTPALKEKANALPENSRRKIEWCGEYRNEDIIGRVFNNVDAIVVPSIWVENSPLVIHEAQQARLPVITANLGGMAEFVKDDQNGLLFHSRDAVDLARQMQRFVDDPDFAAKLGRRGYIKSPAGDVPTIEEHVKRVTELYQTVIEGQARALS